MSHPHGHGSAPPTPERFLEAVHGYQRSAIIKAALDLDLFTAIDDGHVTVPDLATRLECADRGIRSLCDGLAVLGFLTKSGDRYGLAPDAATFLSRKSPACMTSVTGFLLHPSITTKFDDLLGAVRRGGGPAPEESTVATEWPTWVEFARCMVPMMAVTSESLADLLVAQGVKPKRVLDIAAGHGMYGIAVGKRFPEARVTAADWAPVLQVAQENAQAAGLADRHDTVAGDVFTTALGEGYDVVLLTNFLHHFDAATCTTFLRKLRGAMAPGGVLATLEFIPNEDRVSPPWPALFSVQMLAGTPAGDAFTYPELEAMLRDAGFPKNELHDVPRSMQRVIFSRR